MATSNHGVQSSSIVNHVLQTDLVGGWLYYLLGSYLVLIFFGSVAISNANLLFVPPFQSSAPSLSHVIASRSLQFLFPNRDGLSLNQETDRGECCKQAFANNTVVYICSKLVSTII